jgi:hypothetical protein
MTEDTRTPAEIRDQGLEALVERLGAAGALQFLQQFSAPSGDYTRDRATWLEGVTLEDILRAIESRRGE